MKEELKEELKFSPESTVPSNHDDPVATVQSLLTFLAYFGSHPARQGQGSFPWSGSQIPPDARQGAAQDLRWAACEVVPDLGKS